MSVFCRCVNPMTYIRQKLMERASQQLFVVSIRTNGRQGPAVVPLVFVQYCLHTGGAQSRQRFQLANPAAEFRPSPQLAILAKWQSTRLRFVLKKWCERMSLPASQAAASCSMREAVAVASSTPTISVTSFNRSACKTRCNMCYLSVRRRGNHKCVVYGNKSGDFWVRNMLCQSSGMYHVMMP